jgi:RNA polymerase sigma-70 factor, ECF subfamily
MNPGALETSATSIALRIPCPSFDFEDMIRRFGPRLLAVARRFVRNEDDARDVVQDSLIAAFRAMGSFQGQSSPETWLHRIVVNTALMKLRARRRRPETSIEELLPRFLEDGHHESYIHDWPATPEALMGSREIQDLVRSCIDRLPEAYRTILILRDVEELSTEEAARALSITAGAVKLRLHRARQALRGLLAPFFEARGSASSPTLIRGASPKPEHGSWAPPVHYAQHQSRRQAAP